MSHRGAFSLVLVGVFLAAGCGAPEEEWQPPALPPGGGTYPLVLDPTTVPEERYVDMLLQAEVTCVDIDAPTLAAQIETESNWNPDAQSPAGAMGISQFMPDTWAAWGIDGNGDGVADVWDPGDAIPSQGGYMCLMYTYVVDAVTAGELPEGQNLQFAIASYNAGFGAVLQHGGIPPYDETQQYVTKIMSRRHHYALGSGGEPPRDGYPPSPTECAAQGDPMEVGLRPATIHGLRCVRQVFPNVTITSGWRERGSVPGSRHPLGLAIDMASHEAPWNTPEGIRQNWQVAHWYQVNAERLGVEAIIFHNYTWRGDTADRVWRPYDHPGGSDPNLDHWNHVHVSFFDAGGNPDAGLINHSPRIGQHPRGTWLSPEEALPQ